MSTHPIGLSGQTPNVPTKTAPRKPLCKRLFSGIAGSSLSRIDEANTSAQADPGTGESPQKSRTAMRAARWREKQKQESSFQANEAKRKRRKREQDKQDPTKWSKNHPEFPLSIEQLREWDNGGLYTKEAPRGSAKIKIYGGMRAIDTASGIRTAKSWLVELPLRAQLSDAELRDKLRSDDNLQSKIDSILEHWKEDVEFCQWLKELSLDEITQFIQYCGDDLETARSLLYDNTEHRPNVPTLTQSHGARVKPQGIGDDYEGDLPKETDGTFGRRICFKNVDIQILRIGNRNAKFYNLQNGSAEDHFKQFVEDNSDEGVCQLCEEEITPGHFEIRHRQEIIDYIRWYEAKAWRPKKRVCNPEEHARLARVYGGGEKAVKCRKCGRLAYKPPKPPKRSDVVQVRSVEQVAAN